MDVDRATLLVVKLAVGPDLLHVGVELRHRLVLAGLELVLHTAQVHRLFDDRWVIPELQCLPRHRLEEWLRVRVLAKLGEQEQQLVDLLLAESLLRRSEQRGILRRGGDFGYFRDLLLHLTNFISGNINLVAGNHWGIDGDRLGGRPDRLILFPPGLEHLERRVLHLLRGEDGDWLAERHCTVAYGQ